MSSKLSLSATPGRKRTVTPKEEYSVPWDTYSLKTFLKDTVQRIFLKDTRNRVFKRQ